MLAERTANFWRLGTVILVGLAAFGCGTTRWTDTARTATEQMLISDAVDRVVSEIDFSALAGTCVFLDGKYITGAVDEKYIVGTLRQHMLASGCVIKEKVEDAEYIVEVRAGAVGTNRQDLLVGVPQTNLPIGGMFPMSPSSIPEIALAKRTGQMGVCKLAVFAYDRHSGHPVWQSGTRQISSKAQDLWVFGTGPFQRGTIYDGTRFAGEQLAVPFSDHKGQSRKREVSVKNEILFSDPHRDASQKIAGEKITGPKPAAQTQNASGPHVQATYAEPDQTPLRTALTPPEVLMPPYAEPGKLPASASIPTLRTR